ncbi:MAG: HAMP domain-containing sensor histidine kinase [Bacteroidota bacterium]|jgi:two-component system phosphate regulon sensor histidine kinase PhoR
MRIKQFKIAIILVSVVIVSLIALQLYWINNALEVQRQQFENNVNAALHQVVYKLEKKATAAKITRRLNLRRQPNSIIGGKKDFNRSTNIGINEKIKVSNPADYFKLNVMEQITTDSNGILKTQTREKSILGLDTAGSLNYALGSNNIANIFNFQSIDTSKPSMSWFNKKREFVDNIFDELVSVNIYNDYLEKIDTNMVDSLLKVELHDQNVKLKYEFGILKFSRSKFVYPKKQELITPLTESKYKINLSFNNVFLEPSVLTILFPGEDKFILKSSWFMLTGSLVVILTIIAGYYYTFSTILEQKKISLIKNDFINNMTHEFKTPISTISLACDVLSDKSIAISQNKLDKYLKVISDENKRLSLLVENVLQTAILEKGKINLNFEKIEINHLIESAITNLKLQLAKKEAVVHTNFYKDEVYIEGDKVHLTNVINNLIDNALKYSSLNRTIEIKIKTQLIPQGVVLEIEDNGIGISKDNQKRIFENLYRVPTGNIHNVKGFGLGLSYVKAIIEKHFGSISVYSDIDKGSCFRVFLPFQIEVN